jgi:hypothetical protein
MRGVSAKGRQLLKLAVLMMLFAALFRLWEIVGPPLVSSTFSRDQSRSFLSQVHRTTNRNLAMSSVESGQSRTAIQAKVYFALAFGFGIAVIAPLLMRGLRVGWQSALMFYAALLVLHGITPFVGGFRAAEVGWLIYDGMVFLLLICSPVRDWFTPAIAT